MIKYLVIVVMAIAMVSCSEASVPAEPEVSEVVPTADPDLIVSPEGAITYGGKPLAELDKEELIKVIGMLVNGYNKMSEEYRKQVTYLWGLVKQEEMKKGGK